MSFSVDSPYVVCAGGETGGVKVIDLSDAAQGMPMMEMKLARIRIKMLLQYSHRSIRIVITVIVLITIAILMPIKDSIYL